MEPTFLKFYKTKAEKTTDPAKLDNYFKALPEHSKDWMEKEEKNCREVMNFSILSNY